ncbi:MAG: (Fe-S)-binding protein, partial [Pseudomonadales bacterium]
MNPPSETRPAPRVGLFVTCLANVFRPGVAESTLRLLRRAGCTVEVPLAQSCCGQPGYNAGAIAAAKPIARQLIETFE